MDFNFDFDPANPHKIFLTPQLKQALEILIMSTHELYNYAYRQIEINPALEISTEDESTCESGLVTTVEQVDWEHEVLSGHDTLDEDGGYAERNNGTIAERTASRPNLREFIPYIICDVSVKGIRNNFEVILNEDAFPNLKISKCFMDIMAQDTSPDTRKFIQDRINRAKWLIKCIEKRKSILRRITEYITRSMPEFFSKGRDFLKPLKIDGAVVQLNLPEYVFKAAIINKYLQCRWGSFEMKAFFD
ncbi:MAG: hypothetical protein ACOX7R_09930 [Acetivibrionales bacterium]